MGGIVAIANPLLGAGIAAKALLPSLGSKITGEAVKYVTEKLRSSAKRGADEDASKMALDEVRRIKPVVHINPLVAHLETALWMESKDYDPASCAPPPDRFHAVTIRAIVNTYGELLSMDELPSGTGLHGFDIGWLRALARQDKP